MSQINNWEIMQDSTKDLMNTQAKISENKGYIFNQNSTPEWQAQIEQGIELIKSHINHTEKPFSGVSPAELAEQFRHIDGFVE